MRPQPCILQFVRHSLILITVLTLPYALTAQNYRLTSGEEDLVVTGTSTLHDWEVVTEQKSGTMTLDTSGETPEITSLTLTAKAESLKSGKSGMDKNTYKALETDRYPDIQFKMSEMTSISPIVSSSNRYKVTLLGDLTITGTTKKIELECTLTVDGSKISLTGVEPLKMTHYGVDPPTALLGTIKTGDQVEVHFNTLWKP